MTARSTNATETNHWKLKNSNENRSERISDQNSGKNEIFKTDKGNMTRKCKRTKKRNKGRMSKKKKNRSTKKSRHQSARQTKVTAYRKTTWPTETNVSQFKKWMITPDGVITETWFNWKKSVLQSRVRRKLQYRYEGKNKTRITNQSTMTCKCSKKSSIHGK